MSNNTISIQLTYNAGVISDPHVVKNGKLTAENLMKILAGLASGTIIGTSQSMTYTPSLVAGTATITAAAVQSGDNITLSGRTLTAAQRRASGTLTAATAIAGTTCVINGVTFTGVTGAATPGAATFSVDTSNTACATSLAAQINAYKDPRITGVVAAKSAVAIVTVYAVNEGTTGNTYTLAGTATVLVASGATLANGAAATNNTFDFAGSDATTAASLAQSFQLSTTVETQRVVATVSGAVVTVTDKFAGESGAEITLATSNSGRLTISAAALAGGSKGAPVVFTFKT